jgi:hypothetical protein
MARRGEEPDFCPVTNPNDASAKLSAGYGVCSRNARATRPYSSKN